jgi:hypothetical protein
MNRLGEGKGIHLSNILPTKEFKLAHISGHFSLSFKFKNPVFQGLILAFPNGPKCLSCTFVPDDGSRSSFQYDLSTNMRI